ncbi:hypothetical protein B7486_58085, partial [cyanobacterium TDX16]
GPKMATTERLQRGYRVLVPGTCDNDAYTGIGQPYVNHPRNDGENTETVDGLAATRAAMLFVASEHATSQVTVHGHSAGALGATALVHNLDDAGVRLTGVHLDAGWLADGFLDHAAEISGDAFPWLDVGGVGAEKLGPYWAAGGEAATPPVRGAPGLASVETPIRLVYSIDDLACGAGLEADDRWFDRLPPSPPAPATTTTLATTPTHRNCEFVFEEFVDAVTSAAGDRSVQEFCAPPLPGAVQELDLDLPCTQHGSAGSVSHVLTARHDEAVQHPAIDALDSWEAEQLATFHQPPFPYAPSSQLTDVGSESRSVRDAVSWANDQGVVGGWPDATFRPAEPVTRQAAAAFLFRLRDVPSYTPPANPSFTDVGVNHPFRREIEWLVAHDITDGYPDQTFRPGTAVTRQAAAAFLHRIGGA